MTPEPRTVVIADPIDPSALERLRAAGLRVLDASSGSAALAPALPDAWALVVRSRTKVNAALIAGAPKLELVARAGVGVDNVDLAAAAARRITVVNAPSAASVSVAELTVAFALMLVRGVAPAIASTKAGRWERSTQGGELAGRTIGYVGYGRIAREVQRRLAPFGVSAIAHDPFLSVSPDATALVDLETLLARADIVSLHAALTPGNRHLIDAAAFARMKKGAVLINVARGALVDESALVAALKSGRLAGAALDVYETEPPTNAELLALPQVLTTPHIGAATPEGQGRAGAFVVEEVLRAARGEPLTAQVPPPEAKP